MVYSRLNYRSNNIKKFSLDLKTKIAKRHSNLDSDTTFMLDVIVINVLSQRGLL
jgi:hypothetical protein